MDTPALTDTDINWQGKLSYVGADNKEHRPVVIHRAVCGSFDGCSYTAIAIHANSATGEFEMSVAGIGVGVCGAQLRSDGASRHSCPSTWCPLGSSRWRRCRSRPQAKSTAPRSPRPARGDRTW